MNFRAPKYQSGACHAARAPSVIVCLGKLNNPIQIKQAKSENRFIRHTSTICDFLTSGTKNNIIYNF